MMCLHKYETTMEEGTQFQGFLPVRTDLIEVKRCRRCGKVKQRVLKSRSGLALGRW